ncbi:MAG: hypothetical protein Fur0037_22790 [Planctomycetota bacterium]
MSRSKAILIWVCCAIMLFAGAPVSASSPCRGEDQRASTSERGCCGAGHCRCSDSNGSCDCGGGKAPERTPAPPPREKLQAPDEDPQPRPRLEPIESKDPIAPDETAPTLLGPVPARSRQEALSIWRC